MQHHERVTFQHLITTSARIPTVGSQPGGGLFWFHGLSEPVDSPESQRATHGHGMPDHAVSSSPPNPAPPRDRDRPFDERSGKPLVVNTPIAADPRAG